MKRQQIEVRGSGILELGISYRQYIQSSKELSIVSQVLGTLKVFLQLPLRKQLDQVILHFQDSWLNPIHRRQQLPMGLAVRGSNLLPI